MRYLALLLLLAWAGCTGPERAQDPEPAAPPPETPPERVAAAAPAEPPAPEVEELAPRLRAGLVNLRVTSQAWDRTRPWQKREVRTNLGRGFVVEAGVIVTLASVVQDAQMIEVSVANSARLYPARLKHQDPRLNLALVEVTDDELRAQLRPLGVGAPVRLDDEFDLYQLGGDNLLERQTARVVSATADGTTLSLRLNTTLSGDGNGQAAVRDGKIVGLVTALGRGQEGTLLSVETLRHYLDDFTDGVYQGCPGPSLWIQPLLRDDLRAYYGLGADQHGLAVTKVMPGRTGDVREGDVILAVDGYDIDDEGKFVHETHGRLSATYLFQGRRYAGETLNARVLRGGQVVDLAWELQPQRPEEMVVPDRSEGERPEFLVVGGLVILELTQDLNVRRSVGGVVLRRYKERAAWEPPGDRKRIVFVDDILQDPSNKGYEEIQHAPLVQVNGRPIHEIADVAKALAAPQGKFHVFEFEGVESDFVVPVAELEAIDARIAQTYRIPEMRYLR